jgi:hypothetical protein
MLGIKYQRLLAKPSPWPGMQCHVDHHAGPRQLLDADVFFVGRNVVRGLSVIRSLSPPGVCQSARITAGVVATRSARSGLAAKANSGEGRRPMAGMSCPDVQWRATVDEDGHYSFAVPL